MADATDPLDMVIGTNGSVGAADTVLVLKREPGKAAATLYVRGRDVPEADHAPESSEIGWLAEPLDSGRGGYDALISSGHAALCCLAAARSRTDTSELATEGSWPGAACRATSSRCFWLKAAKRDIVPLALACTVEVRDLVSPPGQ